MKNAALILLCLAFSASLIWGCSLHGQVEGLQGGMASLQRRYEVLQILYNQTKEEDAALIAAKDQALAAARASAARPTAAPAAVGLEKVLQLLALPSPAPSPVPTSGTWTPTPEPSPNMLTPTPEPAPLFPLPAATEEAVPDDPAYDF